MTGKPPDPGPEDGLGEPPSADPGAADGASGSAGPSGAAPMERAAPVRSPQDAREEITEALRTLSVEGTRPVQRLRVWWLVMAGVVAAVVIVMQGETRLGGYVLAATLGGAGLLRLVLPTWATGGLVVRGRLIDTATMLALGVATAVLTAALNLDA